MATTMVAIKDGDDETGWRRGTAMVVATTMAATMAMVATMMAVAGDDARWRRQQTNTRHRGLWHRTVFEEKLRVGGGDRAVTQHHVACGGPSDRQSPRAVHAVWREDRCKTELKPRVRQRRLHRRLVVRHLGVR